MAVLDFMRSARLVWICRMMMCIFLLICIGVHVKGVVAPFTPEPMWSHIVHIGSYSLCLGVVIKRFSFGWVVYTMGAIYPFIYHTRCVWEQYAVYDRLSPVCMLVVALMPVGYLSFLSFGHLSSPKGMQWRVLFNLL